MVPSFFSLGFPEIKKAKNDLNKEKIFFISF